MNYAHTKLMEEKLGDENLIKIGGSLAELIRLLMQSNIGADQVSGYVRRRRVASSWQRVNAVPTFKTQVVTLVSVYVWSFAKCDSHIAKSEFISRIFALTETARPLDEEKTCSGLSILMKPFLIDPDLALCIVANIRFNLKASLYQVWKVTEESECIFSHRIVFPHIIINTKDQQIRGLLLCLDWLDSMDMECPAVMAFGVILDQFMENSDSVPEGVRNRLHHTISKLYRVL